MEISARFCAAVMFLKLKISESQILFEYNEELS